MVRSRLKYPVFLLVISDTLSVVINDLEIVLLWPRDARIHTPSNGNCFKKNSNGGQDLHVKESVSKIQVFKITSLHKY